MLVEGKMTPEAKWKDRELYLKKDLFSLSERGLDFYCDIVRFTLTH